MDEKPNGIDLTNDINFLMSVRLPSGKKLKRADIVSALLALIQAWEENDEEYLEHLYDMDQGVQVATGMGNNKSFIFGIMFTDIFAWNQMRSQMNDVAQQAGAKRGGSINDNDDVPDYEMPEGMEKILKDLIEKNEGKGKRD